MHQYGTNQEFFAWTKGCGKMEIIFPQPFFMTYSDGKLPARRPLEGERATKWRGGAVPQEPQMILHSGRPPFGGQGSLCASSLHAASYTLLPLRGISPRESMSLDSRLALLPYESSSFATLKGKQEIVPLNLAPP